jgi:hypothetical protein
VIGIIHQKFCHILFLTEIDSCLKGEEENREHEYQKLESFVSILEAIFHTLIFSHVNMTFQYLVPKNSMTSQEEMIKCKLVCKV